jgi:ABC-2 type transport system permease protein
MLQNIKRTLKHGYRIGIKDLTVFSRSRMRLVSFIVMPIFMMVMMGYIFPSQNSLKNAPLGVVNMDQGSLGSQVVSALDQPIPGQDDKLFKLAYLTDEAEATERIKEQAINGAIIIPADFSDRITRNEQGTIIIITDQSNPQISMLLSGTLNGLMSEITTRLGEEKISSLAPGVANSQAIIKPFVVEAKGVVSGEPNYFEFMAPGLMAMVIMTACMTGLAGSISRERELGTLDGILSSPISRLAIVVGKSFAQGVRGIAQAVITLLLAIGLFGVVIHGDVGLLALLLVLTVFSFIGIGIIISAISSEQETAMIIMTALTFPAIFLSGAFFPLQQMPAAMQWISRLNPLSYSVEALRKCIVLGTNISGMMTEIWVMVGFGVIFVAIAVPFFSKVINR